ncbi:phosphate starvation-inducible protein PhoH [Boudabousia liubingyangii]|uniref:PhoH-like protein n=1 Tax=Boudabousia liubingyangii TaxID=1921764 RepID=A0A1Q5PN07_9ACTO|nr:PhoH family protein [Boudabousia liubingyangii]OKL47477.1 phosphate starvation-inducible protein PhoH [Boudabousia liubingyangii]OKL48899.1 phosphate starvation-inducible protein PhoH [Boudabousia liubingyangii]
MTQTPQSKPQAQLHPTETWHHSSTITIPEGLDPVLIYGLNDQILKIIEGGFPQVKFVTRGPEIRLSGPSAQIEVIEELFQELFTVARSGTPLGAAAVSHAVSLLTAAAQANASEALSDDVLSIRGKRIRPKSNGQARYVEAIDEHTVVFGIGPAGTGKTYLAMAKAVRALLGGQVRRIVLTRPAVEAGESLGFLPGSLTEKIDPYLRPLYDALHDMLDEEALPKLMAAGTIEVAPLAYMRGRTLNDSFIILDEAQNTTPQQMKMFLTRLGFNSKVVVTGDTSQVDLPKGVRSGLQVVQEVLEGVDGIEFVRLGSGDVVRHELVSQIIDAYDRWDQAEAQHHQRGGHKEGKGKR